MNRCFGALSVVVVSSMWMSPQSFALPGDPTGDGQVMTNDIICIARAVAEFGIEGTPCAVDPSASDVDCDGLIGTTDIILAARLAAELGLPQDLDGNGIDDACEGTSCSKSNPCVPGDPCKIYECIDGTCTHTTTSANGNSCGADSVCQQGICVAQECTTASDCDDGNPCTQDGCSLSFTCTVVASMTDGTTCGTSGTCQLGACVCDDGWSGPQCDLAILEEVGAWTVHLGLTCTNDEDCTDTNWCNGPESCIQYTGSNGPAGTYCARKTVEDYSAIEETQPTTDWNEEPDLNLSRVGHPLRPPLISASGRYAYLSHAQGVEILDLDTPGTASIPPLAITQPFTVAGFVDYPGAFNAQVRMAYEQNAGMDYLYTAWAPGRIARIDVTNPYWVTSAQILPSNTTTVTELEECRVDRITIVGSNLVGVCDRVYRPNNANTHHTLIHVWDKTSMVYKGAVAIEDGYQYNAGDSLYEGQFRANAGVIAVGEEAYRKTAPFTLYHDNYAIEAIDDDHILFVSKYGSSPNPFSAMHAQSINLVNIGAVDFSAAPTSWCYYSNGVDAPGACPSDSFLENQRLFHVQYPTYSCFLEPYVEYVTTVTNSDGNDLYSQSYQNAVIANGCWNAYTGSEEIPDIEKYFQPGGDWAVTLRVEPTTLENGMHVAVVSNSTQGVVLWNLDPVLQAAPGSNTPPEVLKMVARGTDSDAEPYISYLEQQFIDPNTWCGRMRHNRPFYADFQCWRLTIQPNGQVYFGPFATFGLPWDVHHELIFSTNSATDSHRYLIGGDTNLVALDFTQSIYSTVCQDVVTDYQTTYWQAGFGSQVGVNETDAYPSVITGSEAIFTNACSRWWKDIAGATGSIPADIVESPDPNNEELLGVYFPDWGVWPNNQWFDLDHERFDVVANWLAGAQIVWKDPNTGNHKSYPVRAAETVNGSVVSVATTRSGDKLFIWPTWSYDVHEYSVSFDPATDNEPAVTLSPTTHTMSRRFNLGGGFHDLPGGDRYSVLGHVVDPPTWEEGASEKVTSVYLYNLNQGLQETQLDIDLAPHVAPNVTSAVYRIGHGSHPYYYMPMVGTVDGMSGKRMYLVTLDMSGLESPGGAAQVASIIPLDPAELDGPLASFGFEIGNFIQVDSVRRVAMFVSWNPSGTLIDLAAYDAADNRLPSGLAATPRVVKKLNYVADDHQHQQGDSLYRMYFRHFGYQHNGYWYFAEWRHGAVGVYRLNIGEGITGANVAEKMNFQAISFVDNPGVRAYRQMVFLDDQALNIEYSGTYSFPACVDGWSTD